MVRGTSRLRGAPRVLRPRSISRRQYAHPVANNVADLNGDINEFIGHYDRSNNELTIRPILPLDRGVTYAVLITRDVYGVASDGTIGPVRSPFAHKAHYAQLPLVERAIKLADIPAAELAFGWTYTTSDTLEPLLAMRKGLYGDGRFSRLSEIAARDLWSATHQFFTMPMGSHSTLTNGTIDTFFRLNSSR